MFGLNFAGAGVWADGPKVEVPTRLIDFLMLAEATGQSDPHHEPHHLISIHHRTCGGGRMHYSYDWQDPPASEFYCRSEVQDPDPYLYVCPLPWKQHEINGMTKERMQDLFRTRLIIDRATYQRPVKFERVVDGNLNYLHTVPMTDGEEIQYFELALRDIRRAAALRLNA